MGKGVDFYEVGKAEVEVGFPNGDRKCINCWGCIQRPLNKYQKMCLFEDRVIHCPDTEIAPFCPLVFKDNE